MAAHVSGMERHGPQTWTLAATGRRRRDAWELVNIDTRSRPLRLWGRRSQAPAARSATCRRWARLLRGLSLSGSFDGGHATKTRERARTGRRLPGAKRVGRDASASSLRISSNTRPPCPSAILISFLSLFFISSVSHPKHDVAQLHRANGYGRTECSAPAVTHLYHPRSASSIAHA